jgi:hypothetical protein
MSRFPYSTTEILLWPLWVLDCCHRGRRNLTIALEKPLLFVSRFYMLLTCQDWSFGACVSRDLEWVRETSTDVKVIFDKASWCPRLGAVMTCSLTM